MSGFVCLNEFCILHCMSKIICSIQCNTRPPPEARGGPAWLRHINRAYDAACSTAKLWGFVCLQCRICVMCSAACMPCENPVMDLVLLLFSPPVQTASSLQQTSFKMRSSVNTPRRRAKCCSTTFVLSAQGTAQCDIKSVVNWTHTHTHGGKKKSCSIREVARSDITSPLSYFCSRCFMGTLIIAVIAFETVGKMTLGSAHLV